jgi:hypothetical protein
MGTDGICPILAGKMGFNSLGLGLIKNPSKNGNGIKI